MPSAKAEFIERIRRLSVTISTEAVTNKSLHDIEHNEVAKMLRNGLAVVGFAALEDFIKRRSSEAMREIGECSVPFTRLPEKLQHAATIDVVSALSYQLNLLDKPDRVLYIQSHAARIASTANSSYELSAHTFGYGQSNINESEIGRLLKCFNVEDPWRQISTIASNIGLTGLRLDEAYRNAKQRRHQAAHVASADTPQNDISQYVKEAFAIAIGFDALLSKSLQKFKENDADHIDGNVKLTAAHIEYRALRQNGSSWKEFINTSARPYRSSTNFEHSKRDTQNRASRNKQLYIELDDSGLIQDWACY